MNDYKGITGGNPESDFRPASHLSRAGGVVFSQQHCRCSQWGRAVLQWTVLGWPSFVLLLFTCLFAIVVYLLVFLPRRKSDVNHRHGMKVSKNLEKDGAILQ